MCYILHLIADVQFLKAVFIWVSKVFRVLLWFCSTSLCDWLKNLAPLFQPIRSQLKTVTTCSHAFSRTWRRLRLLRVLVGSLGNLCLLWLAGVITTVLVLWHSFEKHSKVTKSLCSTGWQPLPYFDKWEVGWFQKVWRIIKLQNWSTRSRRWDECQS